MTELYRIFLLSASFLLVMNVYAEVALPPQKVTPTMTASAAAPAKVPGKKEIIIANDHGKLNISETDGTKHD